MTENNTRKTNKIHGVKIYFLPSFLLPSSIFARLIIDTK